MEQRMDNMPPCVPSMQQMCSQTTQSGCITIVHSSNTIRHPATTRQICRQLHITRLG
jgi:hypothetical protein